MPRFLRLCFCEWASRRFPPLHTCSLAQRTAAARPGLTAAVPATARPFAGSMAANFRSGSVAAAAEYGNTDVKGASELIQSGASIYADVRCAALLGRRPGLQGQAARGCPPARTSKACPQVVSCLPCWDAAAQHGIKVA